MAYGFYIGKIVPSDVDGPGTRSVVHFAGCSIGCPGCFNPHTHDQTNPLVWKADAHTCARAMVEVSPLATISGGEPTDQIEALYDLLIALRAEGAESVVMFTGRRVEWLRTHRPLWNRIEAERLVDVVVDGPYVRKLDERLGQDPQPPADGVRALLDAFSQDDRFACALVTGSVAGTARRKITHFGLMSHFPVRLACEKGESRSFSRHRADLNLPSRPHGLRHWIGRRHGGDVGLRLFQFHKLGEEKIAVAGAEFSPRDRRAGVHHGRQGPAMGLGLADDVLQVKVGAVEVEPVLADQRLQIMIQLARHFRLPVRIWILGLLGANSQLAGPVSAVIRRRATHRGPVASASINDRYGPWGR